MLDGRAILYGVSSSSSAPSTAPARTPTARAAPLQAVDKTRAVWTSEPVPASALATTTAACTTAPTASLASSARSSSSTASIRRSIMTGPGRCAPAHSVDDQRLCGLYFSNTLDLTDELGLTLGGRWNYARIDLQNENPIRHGRIKLDAARTTTTASTRWSAPPTSSLPGSDVVWRLLGSEPCADARPSSPAPIPIDRA